MVSLAKSLIIPESRLGSLAYKFMNIIILLRSLFVGWRMNSLVHTAPPFCSTGKSCVGSSSTSDKLAETLYVDAPLTLGNRTRGTPPVQVMSKTTGLYKQCGCALKRLSSRALRASLEPDTLRLLCHGSTCAHPSCTSLMTKYNQNEKYSCIYFRKTR